MDTFNSQGFSNLNISNLLNNELQFSGSFETGNYPDEWYYRKGMSLENITREICNAWKSGRVVLDKEIGRIASELGGWIGSRVAQDDIWMKPSGGGKEISYHTDCAYIPWPEVTCWIALDDVSPENGTLEIVSGSHLWTRYKDDLDTNAFHAPSNDYRGGLISAASAEGIDASDIPNLIHKVNLKAGGCSFHNGNAWHGSGKNESPNWRRSLAIHFIPSDSSFRGDVGYIYGR
ncbi:protein involved in biosynthesis of mitomycin antibiotics/polyketide fumonisin [Planoprotostelium fungivorum]|uniref:Protein involved in biosynthesis of mitomycin antibiotics/polyketide fumonisin n=1 Tax=Planoprotostelium fungivorum TaxID=1890364 RepID=A0A2P6MX45_9EUKA|nr:protein involved in biosynthesis of mitomycin antibiotics/polyketide fumonisin [Planoprotostelium fungivorum]